MLSRHIASDKNCGVLGGFLVPSPESGEVVATYQTPSLHDVHCSSSLVRLGVMDPLVLGYQSPRSFQYAMSETDSSRDVAGYGP